MKRKSQAVAESDGKAKKKRLHKIGYFKRGSLNTGLYLDRLSHQGDNLEDIPTQMARFEALFDKGDTSNVDLIALCSNLAKKMGIDHAQEAIDIVRGWYEKRARVVFQPDCNPSKSMSVEDKMAASFRNYGTLLDFDENLSEVFRNEKDSIHKTFHDVLDGIVALSLKQQIRIDLNNFAETLSFYLFKHPFPLPETWESTLTPGCSEYSLIKKFGRERRVEILVELFSLCYGYQDVNKFLRVIDKWACRHPHHTPILPIFQDLVFIE